MHDDFWKDRRVLITGHTGFKGGWLAFWLHRLGARVTGLALPPERTRLHDLLRLDLRIDSRFLDIRDAAAVAAVLRETRPEIVFHLAAQALVRRSYAQPLDTVATNVMGTLAVFEAARQAGSVRVLINVTSDKCYENRDWSWGYRETDPMGGYDPYSTSKGCAELLSTAWRRSFLEAAGVRLATVRAGNVIGGGDESEDRLVPDLVQAFAAGQPAQIRQPDAVRPWQHVLEPLHGYLLLAQRLERTADLPRAWNFGPGLAGECRVRDLADRLAALWGEKARWEHPAADHHPHEQKTLRLDISRAVAELGWRPCWSLDETLAATVSWYKGARDAETASALTASQIDDFTQRLPACPGVA